MTWAELAQPVPTPMQELTNDERLQRAGVRLWLKRDDLLAPTPDDPFCGNKWRKLQYNLLAARAEPATPLLSFGGNHSNHIAALASAGRHLGLTTIGILRGEETDTPTLRRARADGMRLHFVSRTAYRQKEQPGHLAQYRARFGPFQLLPEGGSNALALRGCAALGKEISAQLPEPPAAVSVPCGTGGTLAGLAAGLAAATRCIGVAVLKGDFLAQAVTDHLAAANSDPAAPWEVINDYHAGGYARWTPELSTFVKDFYQQHGVRLDPIYGAKHLYGMYDRIGQGHFPEGSHIVAVHTGGLQGVRGFEQRWSVSLYA